MPESSASHPPGAMRRRALRTVRRVGPYLWPPGAPWARRRVVGALAALLAAKLIAVSTPVLYKAAVDALAGDSGSAAVLLSVGAVGLTVAYGGARLMQTGFQELRNAVFARVGQRALRTIARETFEHIHRLSLGYHLARQTGGLSRVIERGVKGVDFLLRFLLFSIGPLFLELLLVAGILVAVFDMRYLLVVLVTVALYVAFTVRVTEWRVRIRREMNDQDTDANQKAIDSLLNYETVKYFGAEGREAARYDAAMAGYERAAVRTTYTLAVLNGGQSLIMAAGLVAVMAMAALGVQSGALSVGDFVMVNSYMLQITMPLGMLGTVYREIRQALVDMDAMFDLLEAPLEVADRPGARPLPLSGGGFAFRDVSFGYERARPILRDIDLAAAPGEHVAVVGPTGSGKSTLARLLFRFYDVGAGAVTVDGQDVRDVTQESLRAAIGVVPQDTVLFNDTIRYNIAYGAPEAPEERIAAAARAARLEAFVESLPEGYATRVGERGLKLSGGEKQRVGIARTLLKDPAILILDEATSSLDGETERAIQESLRAVGRGRTVLTIAHRLSTVAGADRIAVLEHGRIVERGRHEALLAARGRYAAMWRRQSVDAEDAA